MLRATLPEAPPPKPGGGLCSSFGGGSGKGTGNSKSQCSKHGGVASTLSATPLETEGAAPRVGPSPRRPLSALQPAAGGRPSPLGPVDLDVARSKACTAPSGRPASITTQALLCPRQPHTSSSLHLPCGLLLAQARSARPSSGVRLILGRLLLHGLGLPAFTTP